MKKYFSLIFILFLIVLGFIWYFSFKNIEAPKKDIYEKPLQQQNTFVPIEWDGKG